MGCAAGLGKVALVNAPHATPTELRPLGVGEVLDVAIKIFFGNALTLFKVVAVVIVPVELLLVPVFTSALPSGPPLAPGPVFDPEDFAASLGANLVGGAISFVAGALATAACFKAVSDAYLAERPNWLESLRFAWKRVLAVLWVTLLAILLPGLALIAFIIPGIWLWVAWLVSGPAVLSEDVRGFKALGRSFRLVRGRWWPTFGTIALAYLLTSLVTAVVGALFVGVLLTDLDQNGFAVILITQIITAIATVLTTPLLAAVTVVIYYDLRVRKEGFDLTLLAERVGVPRRAADAQDGGARPSELGRPPGDPPGEPTPT